MSSEGRPDNPLPLRDHRRSAAPPLLRGNSFIQRGAAARTEHHFHARWCSAGAWMAPLCAKIQSAVFFVAGEQSVAVDAERSG
jgi:hypothetical protein